LVKIGYNNSMKQMLLLLILAAAVVFLAGNANADSPENLASNRLYTIVDQETGEVVSTTSAETIYYATTSALRADSTSVPTTTTPRRGLFYPIDIIIPRGFFDNISELINGLLRLLMIVAALLVFVYLLWGGIEWITSGGDKGKTESARNKITSAIIGLIIMAAAWALLTIVLNFLGYAGLEDVLNQNINEAVSRQ